MRSFKDWIINEVEALAIPVDTDEKDDEIQVAVEPAVLPAPVKAPPKPSIPVTPQKPVRRNPFKPSQPKVVPGPKQRCIFFAEAWEDTHDDVRRFWDEFPNLKDPGKRHIYYNHPLMRLYGKTASQKGFEHASEQGERHQSSTGPADLLALVTRIYMTERGHEKELESIAKKVVSEIWGVPVDMMDAELTNQAGVEDNTAAEDEDDREEFEALSDKTKRQVYKRITQNAFAHGGSMNAMYKAHHMAKSSLEQYAAGGRDWAQSLMGMYDKFVPSVHKPYWMIPISLVADKMSAGKAGSSRVEYDEAGRAKIVAKGIVFPVLIHELLKGAMELLSHHSLSELGEDSARNVVKYADRAVDEVWLLQSGGHFWRKFLEALKGHPDRPPVAHIVTALYDRKPKEMHEIMMAVLDESPRAKELISKLVKDAKEMED